MRPEETAANALARIEHDSSIDEARLHDEDNTNGKITDETGIVVEELHDIDRHQDPIIAPYEIEEPDTDTEFIFAARLTPDGSVEDSSSDSESAVAAQLSQLHCNDSSLRRLPHRPSPSTSKLPQSQNLKRRRSQVAMSSDSELSSDARKKHRRKACMPAIQSTQSTHEWHSDASITTRDGVANHQPRGVDAMDLDDFGE